MFDLIGKAVGGLISAYQEKLLLDFLIDYPQMAGMVIGFGVVLVIVLPIGPAWLRAESWVGKFLLTIGGVVLLGSFVWLLIVAALVSKGHAPAAKTGTAAPLPHVVAPPGGNPEPQNGG